MRGAPTPLNLPTLSGVAQPRAGRARSKCASQIEDAEALKVGTWLGSSRFHRSSRDET